MLCYISEMLEKKLEKKAGHNYGPTGNKKLTYFIDDLNMPEVDRYGTVQPHVLIRQHIDHGHWWAFTSYLMLSYNFCIVGHDGIPKPHKTESFQVNCLNRKACFPWKLETVLEERSRKWRGYRDSWKGSILQLPMMELLDVDPINWPDENRDVRDTETDSLNCSLPDV